MMLKQITISDTISEIHRFSTIHVHFDGKSQNLISKKFH